MKKLCLIKQLNISPRLAMMQVYTFYGLIIFVLVKCFMRLLYSTVCARMRTTCAHGSARARI